ncbi:MAG: glycosyltransferase family 39 protein, partial [Candidatus Eremiobacteraeota bacterium]|nr:glycosyltransferase family 39 protein [Candidatus Eremiobacteraeota bacterium]
YKIFGVHEVFGRLISIGFSLGTIAVARAFARWTFASRLAGCIAALGFAIYPGSVYYGRTFMPDTAMTFFFSAAVFAAARWIYDDEELGFGRRFATAATLAALALLAKPVAAVGLVPIFGMLIARNGLGRTLRAPATYAFAAIALGPYLAYDAYVNSIAEWHWASGITNRHVLPSLAQAFRSPEAFHLKLSAFKGALGMLATTMLGPAGFGAFVLAIALSIVLPAPARSRVVIFAWLAAALAYAYVVVTVERVDYYLYPFLPLAALATGGLAESVRRLLPAGWPRLLALGAGAAVAFAALVSGRAQVAPYYRYSKTVYRQAKALNVTLPAGLVVMGHYDPSVLYYIGRKGWEEDPYLWTPFDEQSAIRKGARAFVAVEANRLARNVELSAWLERFPIANPKAKWPVYLTDPNEVLPGAEERWREFRRREKLGASQKRGAQNL